MPESNNPNHPPDDEPRFSLTVTPFAELYPPDFESSMKWGLLFQAGRDFYDAISILRAAYILNAALYRPSVAIPLMHQCIELLVKGLLARVEPNAKFWTYRHRTVDLLTDYSQIISSFAAVLANPHEKEFLGQLENGYLKLKYGEAHCTFDFEEFSTFDAIVSRITSEFDSVTGLKF
jgi:hypothetical protein